MCDRSTIASPAGAAAHLGPGFQLFDKSLHDEAHASEQLCRVACPICGHPCQRYVGDSPHQCRNNHSW